ncbi:MAG TPA: hypothetical protein VG325_08535 [Solirubrobacteraceae bacterium]|nr:hypothetical protein [Solirubrobacteraceae bacterium]
MAHLTVNRARLGARALTVAAGPAMFASLFLGWSRLTLRQLALLAVTANGSLTGLSLTHNAWESFAVAAVALTAVSALTVLAAVMNRVGLIRAAGLACVGGLVFVIIQLTSPPSTLPSSAPGALGAGVPGNLPQGDAAGPGETVAIAALVLGLVGTRAMIAVARAERRRSGVTRPRRPNATRPRRPKATRPRRRRPGVRRQRATGSAALPSRAAAPVEELPDGSG